MLGWGCVNMGDVVNLIECCESLTLFVTLEEESQ